VAVNRCPIVGRGRSCLPRVGVIGFYPLHHSANGDSMHSKKTKNRINDRKTKKNRVHVFGFTLLITPELLKMFMDKLRG
jgi:hypothetical protein